MKTGGTPELENGKIPAEIKRVVFVIEPKNEGDILVQETLKGLYATGTKDFVTAIDEKHIILVKSLQSTDDYPQVEQIAKELVTTLNMEAMVSVRAAYGTIVEELKDVSRSYKEADMALEQGKDVYALPGAVTEELSRGCNKLIFDGAGIAYSPEIMLMEWGIEAKNRPQNVEKKKLGLAPDLDLVYSGLDLRPENLDNLIRKTGFSASKVCALLTELQLMGLVGETGRQYYRISGG